MFLLEKRMLKVLYLVFNVGDFNKLVDFGYLVDKNVNLVM